MTHKGNILAVDDTPASLKLLTDLLREDGYEVRAAINGELALHAAAQNPPELVLLDIRMPGIDGYEVCRRLKAQASTRDVPVIFVSAATESDEKVQGFSVGAIDYVTKPYQRDELLARVHTHLELNRLRNHLEDLVDERTAELKESERKLRTSLIDSITALAATVEMRDPYTAGHQRRVAELAIAIAKELHLAEEQIEGIQLAGVVHDVGKIQIPAEILSKPGRLTPLEFELIKQHAQSGYEILKSIDFPWPIARIVLQHHERLNGSGYPQGLKGEQILLEAKIIAVADVVESMTSHRPYRPGLGIDAALQEIALNKGKLYEPAAVDACIRLFRERGYVLPS
ncbi:cyclic di-GMP phosphodiesterase response regulator RpfG [Sideroxyarcus emersonii]|uniref:Cyclic di-GMP phosphodiesterase response regulator RpfG n=1 Tax=Sideroxyarcus emersonii TaxID=2764705 RepID=A0AAN1X962_9PROT|nr:HD domain-containing phosphohydrolase [Sideroxyarcus emersonii]BCK87019.1 cyclic di-GMP phosphodiesterase response regulator RpfG [Sideroxyarcus emersonii]